MYAVDLQACIESCFSLTDDVFTLNTSDVGCVLIDTLVFDTLFFISGYWLLNYLSGTSSTIISVLNGFDVSYL